jgi:hypothetical protein
MLRETREKAADTWDVEMAMGNDPRFYGSYIYIIL